MRLQRLLVLVPLRFLVLHLLTPCGRHRFVCRLALDSPQQKRPGEKVGLAATEQGGRSKERKHLLLHAPISVAAAPQHLISCTSSETWSDARRSCEGAAGGGRGVAGERTVGDQ